MTGSAWYYNVIYVNKMLYPAEQAIKVPCITKKLNAKRLCQGFLMDALCRRALRAVPVSPLTHF